MISLKDANDSEYTVGKGEVIAINNGNITLNKRSDVLLKAFDSDNESLISGPDAVTEFMHKRHQGGAKLNEI